MLGIGSTAKPALDRGNRIHIRPYKGGRGQILSEALYHLVLGGVEWFVWPGRNPILVLRHDTNLL